MCAMSVVLDYGRDMVPLKDWTRPAFTDFQEVLRRLDAIDKKLGQPECHDPAKAEWMKAVEKRLAAMEKKPKRRVVRR